MFKTIYKRFLRFHTSYTASYNQIFASFYFYMPKSAFKIRTALNVQRYKKIDLYLIYIKYYYSMTSITKLFKLVSNNDYETLGQLIESRIKDKINFDCIKSASSLIYQAIQYRAKECFDLLVNIPNYETLLKSDFNGLTIACQYYINAPNPSNEYYINKMLSVNAYVGLNVLVIALENFELFKILFTMANKESKPIQYLMSKCILFKKLNIFTYLHNYVITTENININMDDIINESIGCDNVSILSYLSDLGKLPMTNQNNIPYIYIAVRNNAQGIFNFICSQLRQMTHDKLNQISNINDLSLIVTSYSIGPAKPEYIKSLVELPIKYTSKYIKMVLNDFLKPDYFNNKSCLSKWIDKVDITLKNIFELCKINYETKNLMPNGFYHVDSFLNAIQSKPHSSNIYTFDYLQKIFYIYCHYNLEIDDTVQKIYNVVFTKEQLETFDTDKETYIKSFEPVSVVNKTRKSRKKIEIEL